MNEIDILKKLASNLTERKSVAALSNFLGTLAVYILIWLTVSYVGVYVTYVAAPMLVISGLIAWFTSPSNDA